MKKRYWIGGVATAVVAVKLLSRPRAVDWEKNRATIFHVEHSRFADVNGATIHYQEAGEPTATPLILIHGFASSTLVWSKVFLNLADVGYRVIAPDMLGFGYTSKPRHAQYTIEGQARMIAGLMDRLGIEKATIIGSSYGGAVAATMALDYPDHAERLILIGAVNNNGPLRFTLMRLFNARVVGEVFSPLLIGSRRLLRMRMKRVYDRHEWVLDERRVDARHLPLRAAETHRAIISTVRNWDADRISRDAHLIRKPTLLLWGDNDQEIPLSDGQRLHREIPGSRLIVFQECGHLPHEEYPEEFVEVISNFVQK